MSEKKEKQKALEKRLRKERLEGATGGLNSDRYTKSLNELEKMCEITGMCVAGDLVQDKSRKQKQEAEEESGNPFEYDPSPRDPRPY